LDPEGRQTLARLLPILGAVETWEPAQIEAVVRGFVETGGLKLGKVAQPLRAAVTGRSVSPPIFDVMAILGREEALGRIADQGEA
ncbi:hypothetical protein ACI4AP_28120, partial [Klebsiella pneumoniae]